MSARVSFVMTAYNAEGFIEGSIGAALRQNWPELEVVVVNDGSSDRTGEICREIARSDSRLLVIDAGRVGRARALNIAVEHATGSFIAINDADDFSYAFRLEKAVPVLQQDARLSALATGFDRGTNPSPDVARPAPAARPVDRSELNFRDLYRGNKLVHSTLIFRKTAWHTAGGYNETMTSCIDYEFYFRLLSFGPIGYVDTPMVYCSASHQSFFKSIGALTYLRSLRACYNKAEEFWQPPLQDKIFRLNVYYYPAKSMIIQLWRLLKKKTFGQDVQ